MFIKASVSNALSKQRLIGL